MYDCSFQLRTRLFIVLPFANPVYPYAMMLGFLTMIIDVWLLLRSARFLLFYSRLMRDQPHACLECPCTITLNNGQPHACLECPCTITLNNGPRWLLDACNINKNVIAS